MTQLVGDLISAPKPEFWMFNSEIRSMHEMLSDSRVGLHERPYIRSVLADLVAVLERDLANRNLFQEARIKSEVHHQLRCRPDSLTEKLVVEQWVPALDTWLVSGAFDPATPTEEIIRQLKQGDPRFKSAGDALEEKRAEAKRNRAARDREHMAQVGDAIASMSERALTEFMDVERALHTGETIELKGDDLVQVEKMHEATRKAAARGDHMAGHILQHGRGDGPTCLNPEDNPLKR